MKVYNEKELGAALHKGEDIIEIEVIKLGNNVLRIKACGKAVWGVIISGLIIAIPLVIASVASAGTATPVTAPAIMGVMGPSLAALGVPTTFSLVSIAAGGAIAAGGVGAASAGVSVVKQLRKYEAKKVGNKVTLIKR